MIEWDNWLDTLYTTAVNGIGSAAKSLGMSEDGWLYWLGGHSLEKVVVGTIGKGMPQTKISQALSQSIAGQVDDKLAQHLKVFDPIGLGAITNFSDTVENIKQGNWKPFAHSIANKSVGIIEGKLSETLLMSLAAIALPTAVVGSLPAGVVACAAYMVAGKTVVDTLKRSMMGGTISDHYKTKANFFGIEGVTDEQLNAYPVIKKSIEKSHTNMMMDSEKLTKLYRALNVIIYKLNENERLDEHRYDQLINKFEKSMRQYKTIIENYKKDITQTLECYKSLEKLQKAGFSSKKMSASIKEFADSMDIDLEMLSENILAFNEAFIPAKSHALDIMKDNELKRVQKLEKEAKKEEESLLQTTKFDTDLKGKGTAFPDEKKDPLHQKKGSMLMSRAGKNAGQMKKSRKRQARRKTIPPSKRTNPNNK